MEIPDYSPLFIAVVLFKWAVFIWDEYLTWRQRRVVLNKITVPEPLSHVLDEETMNKTRRYSLDKMTFGFWQSLYSEVETNIILLLFALPWAWDRSGDILNKVPLDWIKDSEIFQSLIFVFFFSVFGLITGFEFSLSVYYKLIESEIWYDVKALLSVIGFLKKFRKLLCREKLWSDFFSLFRQNKKKFDEA